MILFEQIWPVLYDNGASAKKEEGTRRFWETLLSEEQEYAFTIISQKVKEGTTEEMDGWKQANPTGNKVIYVRQ